MVARFAANLSLAEAQLLVTREVLRLSDPSCTATERQPACSDWRITVEQSEGAITVRASRSIEDLAATIDDAVAPSWRFTPRGAN